MLKSISQEISYEITIMWSFIEWYNLDSSDNTLDFSKKTGKIAFYFVRNLLQKWFASKTTISLVYRGENYLDSSDNTLD